MRSPRQFDLPRGRRNGPKVKPWVILTLTVGGKEGEPAKEKGIDRTSEVRGKPRESGVVEVK